MVRQIPPLVLRKTVLYSEILTDLVVCKDYSQVISYLESKWSHNNPLICKLNCQDKLWKVYG
jgi:hypothetical protein